MEYKTFAITSLLLAAVGSTHAVTLFNEKGKKIESMGRISMGRTLSHNKEKEGEQSQVRIGLSGETEISEQLATFGALELQKNLNATPLTIRRATIGLKNEQWGSILYGRAPGIMSKIAMFTCKLPIFGSDALGVGNDLFGTGYTTGLLQYNAPKVNGFTLTLQFQGRNELINANEADKIKDKLLQQGNGEGFGVALLKETDIGLSAGVAYNTVAKSRSQKQHYHNDAHATMLAIGGQYQLDAFSLSATYAQTNNQAFFSSGKLPVSISSLQAPYGLYATKGHGIEVLAQYTCPFGLKSTIAYLQNTVEFDKGEAENVRYIGIGAQYEFTKNFSAAAAYKFNLLKETCLKILDANSEDIVGLNVIYTF